MIPPDETAATFARSVRQILRVEEVGLRWSENVCIVRRFRYTDAATGLLVAVPMTEPPLAVRVLDLVDVDRSRPTRYGGRAIAWEWRAGAIRVVDVDLPTGSETYDVTIEIVR